jgi:hypothetical protein
LGGFSDGKRTTQRAWAEVGRGSKGGTTSQCAAGTSPSVQTYAKCLVATTPQNELVSAEQPKEFKGVKPEDMARMQRETETLTRDFKLIEDSYGRNTLNLVLAAAYLRKLLANSEIVRHLSLQFSDILSELQKLVEAPDLRSGA